jgi:hypothetical protein
VGQALLVFYVVGVAMEKNQMCLPSVGFFNLVPNGFVYEKCVLVSADFRNENRMKASTHLLLV